MAVFLVTGGAGFIGSHIVQQVLATGHQAIVIDNFSSGSRHNLIEMLADTNLRVIEGDICAPASWQAVFETVDHVIHCAAKSAAESMQQPDLYHQVNVVGTQLRWIGCIAQVQSVVSSSAAIYGDNPLLPKQEGMPAEPKSPYAQNKLDDEKLLAQYASKFDIRTVALRYFNVFGPRQDPHSPYAAAMPHFIQQAVSQQPITIFGDGLQTRDFVFVADVARANIWAAQFGNGVFNVASG